MIEQQLSENANDQSLEELCDDEIKMFEEIDQHDNKMPSF